MKFLIVVYLLANAALCSSALSAPSSTSDGKGISGLPLLRTQQAQCNLPLVNGWLETVSRFVEEDRRLSSASGRAAAAAVQKSFQPLKVAVGESAYGGLGMVLSSQQHQGVAVKALEPVLRIPMSLSISMEAVAFPSGPLMASYTRSPWTVNSDSASSPNGDAPRRRDIALQHYRRPYGAVLAFGKANNRLATPNLLAMALMAEDFMSEAQRTLMDPMLRRAVLHKQSNASSTSSAWTIPIGLSPFAPWLDCLPQLADLPHADMWRERLHHVARAAAVEQTRAEEEAIAVAQKQREDSGNAVAGNGIDTPKALRKALTEKRRLIVKALVSEWSPKIEAAMAAHAEPRPDGASSQPPANLQRSAEFRYISSHSEDTEREYKRSREAMLRTTTAPAPTATSGGGSGSGSVVRTSRLLDLIKASVVSHAVCVTTATATHLAAHAANQTAKLQQLRDLLEEEKRSAKAEDEDDDSSFFEDDEDNTVANAESRGSQTARRIAALEADIIAGDASAEELMALAAAVSSDCGMGAVWEKVSDAIIPSVADMDGLSARSPLSSTDLSSLRSSLSTLFDKVFTFDAYARATTIHSSRAWNIRGQQYLVPISDFFNYSPRDDEVPHLAAVNASAIAMRKGNEAIMNRRTFTDRSADFLTHHHIRQSDGTPTISVDFSDGNSVREHQRHIEALGRQAPRQKSDRQRFAASAAGIYSALLSSGAERTAATPANPQQQQQHRKEQSLRVLSFLASMKGEDDGAPIDPKRPSTATEQYFEVLADRSLSTIVDEGRGKKKGASASASAAATTVELFESYGDSNSDVYFRYHGFAPAVNPYECVQLPSYSVYSVGGTFRQRDTKGAEHVVAMRIGELLSRGARGLCTYNTTMYQYALPAGLVGVVGTLSGGSSSTPRQLVLNGELDPTLLVWSLGAAAYHGAADLAGSVAAAAAVKEDAAPFLSNTDDEPASSSPSSTTRRVLGTDAARFISRVFAASASATDGSPHRPDADSFAGLYFNKMAQCTDSLARSDLVSPHSQHQSQVNSHGGYLKWYTLWLRECGRVGGPPPSQPPSPSASPPSTASLSSPLASPAMGVDDVADAFVRRLLLSKAEEQQQSSAASLPSPSPSLIAASAPLMVPAALKWMRLVFARQQLAVYRGLILHSFRTHHATSQVDEDEQQLATRRRLIGLIYKAMVVRSITSVAHDVRTVKSEVLDALISADDLALINELTGMRNSTGASLSSAGHGYGLLPLQLVQLQSEASFLEFRLPKKGIYRSHLSLLRLKTKRVEKQLGAAEAQLMQLVEEAVAELRKGAEESDDEL